MKTSDFSFDLPEELIAQYPPKERGNSRLMVLDRATGKTEHRFVRELSQILSAFSEKPLLVFNETKVRKARLLGKSESGAEAEFLLVEGMGSREWGVGSGSSKEWKALAQRAKRRKAGSSYTFYDTDGNEIAKAVIKSEDGEFRFLEFDRIIDDEFLDRYGHIPLPPYIRRADEKEDANRYQTIYAKQTGSAAAPTAGLHFTREILDNLACGGIESVFITLHVGLGTFLPVRSENIEEHVMHRESFFIDEQSAKKIEEAKAAGRKIITVGTTSARTLESAWEEGKLKRGQGSTDIFIYPGYKFKITDALFTNFHTPESTLLMLVSAFAGRQLILESYAQAVAEKYRFFSYGDAMLII
jgi:S-adenosylmethionine:tRNA ribosyltransferase-isomerase